MILILGAIKKQVKLSNKKLERSRWFSEKKIVIMFFLRIISKFLERKKNILNFAIKLYY